MKRPVLWLALLGGCSQAPGTPHAGTQPSTTFQHSGIRSLEFT